MKREGDGMFDSRPVPEALGRINGMNQVMQGSLNFLLKALMDFLSPSCYAYAFSQHTACPSPANISSTFFLNLLAVTLIAALELPVSFPTS